MNKLELYYNKFNEEKRLDSRHGQVEFRITMKYILEEIEYQKSLTGKDTLDILDIGAGTGRYSIPLSEMGHRVTAIEPVKHNLGRLKARNTAVNALQGNALNLKKLGKTEYDVVLLFGPMYHLLTDEEKCKALSEASRMTREGGSLLVAYVMNEYGVITYGFKERHVLECMEQGRFSEGFKTHPGEDDLYDYVRIEDINRYNETVNMSRVKILSPDGPANYIRPFLNQLSEEEFEQFVQYQMAVCEREDLIGAGAHTVDILRKDRIAET